MYRNPGLAHVVPWLLRFDTRARRLIDHTAGAWNDSDSTVTFLLTTTGFFTRSVAYVLPQEGDSERDGWQSWRVVPRHTRRPAAPSYAIIIRIIAVRQGLASFCLLLPLSSRVSTDRSDSLSSLPSAPSLLQSSLTAQQDYVDRTTEFRVHARSSNAPATQ